MTDLDPAAEPDNSMFAMGRELFRNRPNPEAFSNLFHDLVKRAGLRPIRLHYLRHSYATAALAAGVPVKVVSQRIGHADITATPTSRSRSRFTRT